MMKNITKFIVYFSLVFLSFNVSASVTLSQFAIQSQFLIGGQLKPNSGAPTPFTADFTMVKSGTTYNTVTVSLVYIENSTETQLSTPITRYDGDWSIANSNTWQTSISGTLPAGKTAGVIYFKYTVYDGSVQGATSNSVTGYRIYIGAGTGNPGSGGTPADNEYNKRFIVGARTISTNGQNVVVVKNDNYHLDFQIDGNLVLYKNNYTVLWASNTQGRSGDKMEINAGTINLFSGNSSYWTKDTYPPNTYPNYVWVIQDDGNFVGYTNYNVDAKGNIVPIGGVLGSTNTQGGQVSYRFGKL